ncbi:hypothetical protein RND81_10G194300 [Saponaria officinalis]
MSNFLIITCIFYLLLNLTTCAQLTEFIFDDFSTSGNSITLKDSAILVNHNKFIRLTNTTQRMMGHAFYSTPVKFKTSPGGQVLPFSTTFTFGTVPEFQKLGGHGMAFVISPTNDLSKKALPSQYLGLFSATDIGNLTNHVFAVELDTVQDFEFGDINDNHIGIDLNNLVSNVSVTAAYALENLTMVNITMKDGQTIQTWIDYDPTTHLINVTISLSKIKPRKPLISYKYDLSDILEEKMYVGFAGSTGLLASSHYVLGWSFNMSGPAVSLPMPPLPIPSDATSKRKEVLAVSLSTSLAVFFVLVVLVAIYIVFRIKDRDIIEEWELTIGPHRYPYHDLRKATKGFRDRELLGRGGFGRVYHGVLPKSDTQIAVKRINHESKQGLPEFVAEIASIGRLRHRNLVQLLGWCRRRGDLLLVYDYMPYGSLEKYLFDQPNQSMVLSWDQRFRIIKGVASGLLYLHEGWEKVVIHRDIKASNVLLDVDFNGRLGDFGLARLHDHGTALGTTRVVGTLGYLAPEMSRTGHVTTSSDVFAFGALLLEVVCGRRPIDHKASTPEELVLVDWVWQKLNEGNIMDVLDPKLKGQFNESEMIVLIKLGLMCSSDDPAARPSMRLVVRYLEGEMPLPQVVRAPSLSNDRNHDEPPTGDYVYSFASSSSGVSLHSYTTREGLRGIGAYASVSPSTM